MKIMTSRSMSLSTNLLKMIVRLLNLKKWEVMMEIHYIMCLDCLLMINKRCL